MGAGLGNGLADPVRTIENHAKRRRYRGLFPINVAFRNLVMSNLDAAIERAAEYPACSGMGHDLLNRRGIFRQCGKFAHAGPHSHRERQETAKK